MRSHRGHIAESDRSPHPGAHLGDGERGEWNSLKHFDSTSFDIYCTASAGKDLFCFGGRAKNGDLVIQRWTAGTVMHRVQGHNVPLIKSDGMVGP